ncbi:PREDICTED: probable root meristem growth factor 8 [Nelumbo nucifera]|uniref:Root meristem growth factor 8 n=2 Tax=Nelumbo nucifera TaxID=4432 RepID=A0A822YRH3_NELNU|nr:PREDICTED: probable root meristem growth factor 8 [Nelumbo nucifera]DAD35120.1 TPA_asm: hypothetical protein HUJ06_005760 [Nelumbo nucifera]
MGLIVITMLCFVLLTLTTACASLQAQLHSLHPQDQDPGLLLTKLPRKLRLLEEPMVQRRYMVEDFIADYKQKGALLSGKINTVGVRVRDGRQGTRQKWVEGAEAWQFFTMDYARVRRRRPIHNKAVPVGLRP